MASCTITGKKPLTGNRVSHAKNRRKHRQQANVQSKRIWDDEAKRWVRLKVSARALRLLNRRPLSEVRRKFGVA